MTRFIPVAEHGLLVEFAAEITDETSAKVLGLDQALTAANIAGIIEIVPAFVNVLVLFDPLLLDHDQVETTISDMLPTETAAAVQPAVHQVPVCYDGEFGQDLPAVAAACNMSQQAMIEAHLAGDYRVGMYGFAPGYAYLSGVPEAIQVPRKPAAVPGVPAGAVIIAGAQCLITTLEMPTGWSILGRSPTQILQPHERPPVLFAVGDRIQFVRIDRAAFDAASLEQAASS